MEGVLVDLLPWIVALVGGFISGIIFRFLPGKLRLVLYVDGKLLNEETGEAEIFGKPEEIKIPATLAVPVVLFLAFLYAVYALCENPVQTLTVYLLWEALTFMGGIGLAAMNKISADAEISKEAVKVFTRKLVVVRAPKVPEA